MHEKKIYLFQGKRNLLIIPKFTTIGYNYMGVIWLVTPFYIYYIAANFFVFRITTINSIIQTFLMHKYNTDLYYGKSR